MFSQRVVPQVTEEVSNQGHEVLLMTEQGQKKEVTDAKKKKKKRNRKYGNPWSI